MSLEITITSLYANTPVLVEYCDALSANCVTVGKFTSAPIVFNVPSPYSDTDFVIKITDDQDCIIGEVVPISPTPTQTVTQTQTPSFTPTTTVTPTITPTTTVTSTISPTITNTSSQTPTITKTPSQTIKVVSHFIGRSSYQSSDTSCLDIMTNSTYFTYASGATFIPVINSVIYQNSIGETLINPVNGDNKFLKMQFGSSLYAVRIDTTGGTVSYTLCS